MGVGRPQSLHGQGSDAVIELELWHRRAMGDARSPGRIDGDEAIEGMGIVLRERTGLRDLAGETFRRDEHVARVLGAGSLESRRVQASCRELLRVGNVTPFRRADDEDDGEAA